MEKGPNNGSVDSKPLTTFVQVDTGSFREAVQRLTGPSEANTALEVTTTKGNNYGVNKPTFKLHERRQYRAKLEITKPSFQFKPGGSSSQQYFRELHSLEQQRFSTASASWNQSPSGTPSKCLSNLSLIDKYSKVESASHDLNIEEEEKAIKERRFYLHPSPRSKLGFIEPQLLNLFPVASPKNK
ncbi:hypothetical protein Ancab_000384 [Ancistrocladus abbreviatus]